MDRFPPSVHVYTHSSVVNFPFFSATPRSFSLPLRSALFLDFPSAFFAAFPPFPSLPLSLWVYRPRCSALLFFNSIIHPLSGPFDCTTLRFTLCFFNFASTGSDIRWNIAFKVRGCLKLIGKFYGHLEHRKDKIIDQWILIISGSLLFSSLPSSSLFLYPSLIILRTKLPKYLKNSSIYLLKALVYYTVTLLS